MIPIRVYVENFLCHDKQEFVFDGHPVLLLHGPNGVGKSAVFDAMVYALFDEPNRREGSGTKVGDLVRYGATSMRVEFDFEYRGRRYRVWRTRSRSGQPKQGVGELVEGATNPRMIRDINKASELADWVRKTLGLTYDAFVSAVLLRQGATERLIDARRDERRDLFRGVIDLDPYVKLHATVTEARAGVNGDVRRLRATLEQHPEVSAEAVAAATARLEEASSGVESALATLTAARARLAAAQLWDALEANRQTVLRQLAAASERASRAAELERAVERLRHLRVVVPALTRIATLRSAAEEAAEVHRLRAAQLAEANDRLRGHTDATAAARGRAAEHRHRCAAAREAIATAAGRRSQLDGLIRQAEQAEGLHRQLGDGQTALAGFATDLDDQLSRAEEALAQAQEARGVCSHLEALVRHRAAYAQAAEQARSAARDEADLCDQLKRLREEAGELAGQAEVGAGKAEGARRDYALAEARLTQASERRDQFGAVDGAAVCPTCGQKIDAAHAARERANLDRAVADATQLAEARKQEAVAATAEAERAARSARDKASECTSADTRLGEAVTRRRQAENLRQAAEADFTSSLRELPAPIAARVAPIQAAEGYPSGADAHQSRELGSQVGLRTQARGAIDQQLRQRREVVHSIATLTQAVQAVGAPPDVTAARAELTECDEHLRRIREEHDHHEHSQQQAEQEETHHAGCARAATDEVNRLTGEAGGARVAECNAQRAYQEAVHGLPPGTLNEDTGDIQAELERLERADVERDFNAMAEDRTLQAERERQHCVLEEQITDRVPADARRPSMDVAPEVESAMAAVEAAEAARDAACRELGRLTDQRDQRTRLQSSLAEAARNHSLHDRLAELLGAEGIQLHLLRQAERRIIDLANDTIGRVSRGELRFEPPDPGATQAFDLSVRRVGCSEPIPVGNLSGGQRCRVAVALALAVCRFACGEAQPLESVIIDEAFANLDRDGRMAMIDVIRDGQVAGGVLRRIIVVSHHEDVSAAFPVGYRLENVGGTTVVSRL